jgi:hypothetical protein
LTGTLRPGNRGFVEPLERPHGAARNLNPRRHDMVFPNDIPLCERLDQFAWDPEEVRDLIRTTPLRFDDTGLPTGYEAEQLFGLEGARLGGRSW